jgi:hypothetical protein
MRAWTSLSILSLLLAASPTVAQSGARSWLADKELWEARLAEAEMVSKDAVGSGVTHPERVSLRADGVDFAAVFKPIARGRHGGFFESYESEVAAYRLDGLLGLEMVPPTVVRRIGGDLGSLQLWVEDCAPYKSLQGKVPQTSAFSHQISRMKMFDNLISNADRNSGNFLLDQQWNVVLIDHSRAFLERKKLFEGSKLPAQYDRRLVERLRTLERAELDDALGELLRDGQIAAILFRRDRILEHLAGLVASRGEAAVLFDP